MSKGIIMAENMEEAVRSHDSLYLENDLLGEVFYSIEKEKKKYPVLFKLVRDEYEDSEFDVAELPRLVSEITILLKGKTFTKKTTDNLRKILDIAKVSNKEKKALFALAD